MHIGIVSPCSSGPLADLLLDGQGADLGWGGYFIATLVRALIGRGHQVSVITLSPNLREKRILRGPSLAYYVFPTRLKARMRDAFKLERQALAEGIRLAKPELLHAHWTYEFAIAALASGIPTLVTTHDNGFRQLGFCRDLYRLGRLFMQVWVMRTARYLTAVSPYLAESLSWLSKVDIQVIPNPIEAIKNVPAGSASNEARIGTVLNGWGHRKNPKAAIKAFRLLRGDMPTAQMYMYGIDFEEGGVAWKWTQNNRMADNIHFCGSVKPIVLQTRLRTMSMLLHPSREEACPMALLEAMALGLPVVAGEQSGGVPWVLDHGHAGFLTDVTNPTRIAETMLHCVRDERDREEKRENALLRIETAFSPDRVAEQYEKVYEQASGFA